MNRFLSDETPVQGNELKLSEEESHHLARVLRLGKGDEIALIDGKGALARAVVVEPAPRAAVARVVSVEISERRSRLHLCFGIPKGPALEFIVRRGTEIGVAAFQPLGTRHSLPADTWNERRWRKVIVEVAKQCEELCFPEPLPPLTLKQWLGKRDGSRVLVFCDETRREAAGFPADAPDCCYDLLIGPEGGWSEEEKALVLGAGAVALGLGKNRLRAEVAALVAMILVKQRIGEL